MTTTDDDRARCDGPGCGTEATKRLVGQTPGFPASGWGGPIPSHPSYALPAAWKRYGSATFCSWRCLGNWASEQQEATP